MFKVPEQYRVKTGAMASCVADGNNGYFVIPMSGRTLAHVIASDGLRWEHVSVHMETTERGKKSSDRTPTWAEMCRIKNLFWDDEDTVIQYHPPKSEYINNHKYCLHLWRPIGVEIPRPPSFLVGL